MPDNYENYYAPQTGRLHAAYGEKLGGGIRSVLDQITQQKLNQMAVAQQKQTSLKDLIDSGIDPKTAQFLSITPAKDWGRILQSASNRGFNAFGQQQEQGQGLAPRTGGATGVPEVDALQQRAAPRDIIESLGRQPNLSPEKAAAMAQQERHYQEGRKAKELSLFNKDIAPIRKEVDEDVKFLQDSNIENEVREGLKLLKSGKGTSGLLGIPGSLSSLPYIGASVGAATAPFYSAETNQLRSLYDKIARFESEGMGGGQLTQGKIALAKADKPNLAEQAPLQIKKLKNYYKKLRSMRLREKSFQKALDTYKGNNVNEFRKIYNDYYDKYLKIGQIVKVGDKYMQLLPNGKRKELTEKNAKQLLGE